MPLYISFSKQGGKPENVEVKKEKKSHKKRRKGLYKRLAEQLEFYFSDANLRNLETTKINMSEAPSAYNVAYYRVSNFRQLLMFIHTINIPS